MRINILAIESSCDETAAAVICNGKVRNNIIASQAVHSKYGGVVPELASRAHEQKIVEVVDQALRLADLEMNDLDAIAFTRGPGLLGSLLVGVSFAKGLAMGLGIPLIEVNHMQAHIMAHFIRDDKPELPFLCLTVSGGHTQIVLMENMLDFRCIGQTRDDAAGEAFDKGAKMLGLPYPGGPEIDRLASKGNPHAFDFPHTSLPGYDFSFSGIKTSLLYLLKDKQKVDSAFISKNINDLSASYQYQINSMLLEKLKKAAGDFNISQIGLAGGVAANSGLRKQFEADAYTLGWKIYVPDFQYCTDNAAMIAITAHFKFLNKEFASLDISPALISGKNLEL
jgi:N6-L-threonylcarbamoyladenine synthase